MLVCHAVVRSADDGFWVWAESPEAPDPTGVAPTAGAGVAAHPLAAHGASLRELLDFLGLSASSGSGARCELATMFLPSAGTGTRCRPLPSACVLKVTATTRRPAATAAGKPTMRPWSVPALALSPPAAADLALALVPPHTGSHGNARGRAVAGDSLRWIAAVTELALEMLARGRVLPAVVSSDGPWEPPLLTGSRRRATSATTARWLPMPTPEDLARMAELAAAMPPVCRSALDIAPGAGRPQPRLRAERTPRVGPPTRRSCWSVCCARSSTTPLTGRWPVPRLAPPRRGRRPTLLPVGEALLEALAGPPLAGLPLVGLPLAGSPGMGCPGPAC